MAHRKRDLVDALSIRLAIAKDKNKRWRERRAFHSKRTAMLFLGAALSVGGVNEAFDQVHFLVQKDLDGVQLVRKSPEGESVVAEVRKGLAGNSLYKLAGIVPDRFVSRESDLMENGLFADPILAETFLAPIEEVAQATAEAVAAVAEAVPEPPVELDFVVLSREIREDFFKELPFGSLIHEKSEKYGVDPLLVAAVIENESRFKPRARSPVGARGLMQLMPRTGAWMGARNLYDPEQNVDAGVKYLKYLDKRFKGNRTKVIAAYNGGEGNVMRYGGIPPFRETRTYVKRVNSSYEKRAREFAAYEANALKQREAGL